MESAQFAVFRDENGDWKWHVLHLEALAQSNESADAAGRRGGHRARQVPDQLCGLMELTTSAFRLYGPRRHVAMDARAGRQLHRRLLCRRIR